MLRLVLKVLIGALGLWLAAQIVPGFSISGAASLIAAAVVEPSVAFVCGSNGFVEAASQLLLSEGLGPGQIRTERFGPTG